MDQKGYTDNIQEAVDLIERIQRLMIDGQDAAAEQATELAEIMSLFGNNVLYAEQAGNQELIRQMMRQVLPELYRISDVIQEFGVAVRGLMEEGIYEKLEGKQGLIRAMLPDSMTHVLSDGLGNAGDYILGRSQRRLIEQNVPDTLHWNIVDVGSPVTEDFLDACNCSKGLVIGGGGLFLLDSNVNEISGWQWPCSIEDLHKIKVPIYVMGVGYNRFREQADFDARFTENINALVEQSTFFGLRNHGSIRAVRSYLREELREKVQYFPCATTVLSKLYELPQRSGQEAFIAVNCAFDRAHLRFGDRQDEIMNAVARVLKVLSGKYRICCYIQCRGDVELIPYLERTGVVFEVKDLVCEMTEEEYLRYYTEPELVLAMRGHAQMIPFGCGTPVVSIISHNKLAWFLEDIGHPEWGVDVTDTDFEKKLLSLSWYMLDNRERISQEINVAQEGLWQSIQDGLGNGICRNV